MKTHTFKYIKVLIFTLLILIFLIKNIAYFENEMNIQYSQEIDNCNTSLYKITESFDYINPEVRLKNKELSVSNDFSNILCLGKVSKFYYDTDLNILEVETFSSTNLKNVSKKALISILFLISFKRLRSLICMENIYYFILIVLISNIVGFLDYLSLSGEIFLIFLLLRLINSNVKNIDVSKIKRISFREDINTLRAVAVVSVLFYHAGLGFFSGGWLGVDIFFVISGYLISNIIISQLNSHDFKFKDFYIKRIKRIIPALFFVFVATIPFSFYFLSPKLMIVYVKSLFSSLFFYSNYFFSDLDFYTAGGSELLPLLHTWSLAIEEQFYIIFPIMIFIIYKYFFNHLYLIMSLFFSFSLLANFNLEYGFQNTSNLFYMPQFRFWQLLFGAILMMNTFNSKTTRLNFSPIFAYLLLFVPIFYFTDAQITSLVPKLLTLFGVGFIILYENKRNFLSRIYESKFISTIGLSSYSIYLLHQPVFAYYRSYKNNTFEELNNIDKSIAVSFIIILSYLIWRYIETPFLKSHSNSVLMKYILISIVLISSFSFFALRSNGELNRYEDIPEAVTNLYTEESLLILKNNEKKCEGFENYCKFLSGTDKNIVILGDSQSELLSAYLYEEYKNTHNIIPLIGDRFFRCVFYEIELVNDCLGGEKENFETFIKTNRKSTYIFFASHERFDDGWLKGKENFTFYFKEITKYESDLIIINSVPYVFKNQNIKELYLDRKYKYGDLIGYPYLEWSKKNNYLLQFFQNREKAFIIDPTDLYCQNIIKNYCVNAYNDKIFYYDKIHLSKDGVEVLSKYIFEQIEKNKHLLKNF